MEDEQQRYTGIVESWIDGRGFGFIRRDGDTGRSIFVHARDITNGEGNRTLIVGQRVEFEVVASERGPRCQNLIAFAPE